MHVQVLASGSGGNSTLVRAGELRLLVDAGLPARELAERLERAREPLHRLDHVVLSHGHLDHARGAGELARLSGAWLHCSERMLRNASVRRAPRLAQLAIGRPRELAGRRGDDRVLLRTVRIPHDAEPTVAFAIEHRGRRLAIVTDMGSPDPHAAQALAGAHVLLLEFNHDPALLRDGPYSDALKRRIAGPLGHLSNDQAATMLGWLAGPELHTLVLVHLSRTNNTPLHALAAAREALERAGRPDVRVLVAEQDAVGPNVDV